MNKTTRAVYAAPKLTRHGTLAQVTQGQSVGTFLDASFPTGTPFSDLTFS